MSRAKKHWSDTNRFNQTLCMEHTLFPKIENYKSIEVYKEDYRKAERRAYCHDRLIKLKALKENCDKSRD